jgi:hypothetical protein
MRIPVFRSEAAATSEAPGASIRARMDPNVFVQAELRKGEVLGEAFTQVNKYALARAEAEAKIEYNEALLGAEEQMRNLADSLKESSRLGDVLNEKGTGAWQVSIKEMRDRLTDGLSSRSMTDAFNARFNQQELTMRFQLRDAVESNIKARAAAASKARQDELVNTLSDPRTNAEMASMLLTAQTVETESDIRAGIISPEVAAVVNTEMLNKIVDNVTLGYVGGDPSKALSLAAALEYQALVNAGEMTAEEAAELSGLGPDGAYTLTVLGMARPDIATKALGEALTNANKIDGALDEMRTEFEARVTKQNGDLYNSAFGVSVTAEASADLTARLVGMMTAKDLQLFNIDPSKEINGKQYLDVVTRILDSRNAMSQEQRKSLDTHKNPNTLGPFAAETNPSVYASLIQKADTGNLTQATLNASQGDLTLKDWKELTASIQTEADEAFRAVDDQVAAAFRYNKAAGANDAASKEAEAAWFYVSSKLREETNRRISEGDRMTREETSQLAQQLIEERMVTFRVKLQNQLQEYLQDQSHRFIAGNIPDFPPGNELQSLEAWYSSLLPEPTQAQTSVYNSVKGEIIYMMQMMGNQ